MNQYRSSVFIKGADHCSDFDVYMVACCSRLKSPKHTILTKKTVRKDEAGSYALVTTPKKSKSYNNGEAFVVEVKGAREELYSGNAGAPRLVVLGAEHEETERDVGSAEGCQQLTMPALMETRCEAFTFSAFFRQDSSVPDGRKYDLVDEVLDLLDMHDIADQIIRGSSVEEMKRLAIGVDIAAQPSVIFLDEPTSGLDARLVKLIINGGGQRPHGRMYDPSCFC
ncbi:unnamed protein product [Peronospora destructor]|uniref:ABC transporter domain-containing protein n=1 Tax=Peronospora destructor TaxID=86335 RepID=A0AAV0UV94_9STRA|nr:unnamed protein product [Peronospora destructor]